MFYIIHVNILLQIILIDSFISESLPFSQELQGESLDVILQLQFWGKPSILLCLSNDFIFISRSFNWSKIWFDCMKDCS